MVLKRSDRLFRVYKSQLKSNSSSFNHSYFSVEGPATVHCIFSFMQPTFYTNARRLDVINVIDNCLPQIWVFEPLRSLIQGMQRSTAFITLKCDIYSTQNQIGMISIAHKEILFGLLFYSIYTIISSCAHILY